MMALIHGKRYQGKSTLAATLALTRSPLAIVFDPNGQFRSFPRVSKEWPLTRVLDDPQDTRIVVFRPAPGMILEDFAALSHTLWPAGDEAPRWAGFSFVIDECSTIQSPSWIHPDLQRWLRLAPADVTLIQTTHRLVDTNRLSRSLATDLFFFHMKSGRDLDLISDELEDPAFSEQVRLLGVHQVAHYASREGGKEAWWIWRRSADWYVRLQDNGNTSYGSPERATSPGQSAVSLSAA